MLGSDKGYDHLYEISTRDDNRHTVHGFIPAIMERRFTFIDEQDAIVKCAIRSMLNWRASVDWGGLTWMPSDYLIGLLCVNAHDTLGKFLKLFQFRNSKHSKSSKNLILKSFQFRPSSTCE